ncbi:FIST C-terminal domain-containing protein [Burkholderiaceae bacterium DAT-1]|nr:FIST C-terminal domain-containing protein [Burkholderiaceae bacterium DAT-1]
MHIRQFNCTADTVDSLQDFQGGGATLVLVFGSVQQLATPGVFASLRSHFPRAHIAGCSTAGEISSEGVSDDGLVVTAVQFENVTITPAVTHVSAIPDSQSAGERLAALLAPSQPDAVLLFGPGVDVNGSALIAGLTENLPGRPTVSGGLAGDGGAFKQTLTLANGEPDARQVVAIGLKGANLKVQHGSRHGWIPFGPARRVTRCEGNLLYELDNEPALSVYKLYLGEYARDLPASGLLFPFEMLGPDQSGVGLIRTILGIDEEKGMLILAGDIIENGYLKLMHASTDSLVDGAEEAAVNSSDTHDHAQDALALLVSCVGRKLVMGSRVDEEIEAVSDQFGKQTVLTGFYSYGEISPDQTFASCALHNQTMTITLISEHS